MRLRSRVMLLVLAAIFGTVAIGGSFQMRANDSPLPASTKVPWTITAGDADRETAAILDDCLRSAQKRIESFFGHPFEKPFGAEVFPDRSKFDEYCKKRWQL